MLRQGGNAADAAVAMAGTLGVTEPYSSGIGGGGFFVYYDAASRQVSTIDGRESAPPAFSPTVFTGSGRHGPRLQHRRDLRAVDRRPGTLALWDTAARRFGTRSLAQLLGSRGAGRAQRLPGRRDVQPADGRQRGPVREVPGDGGLFLPGGQPPAVGSTFRNPDLARTYDALRHKGIGWFYGGALGTRHRACGPAPATAPGVDVYPGRARNG